MADTQGRLENVSLAFRSKNCGITQRDIPFEGGMLRLFFVRQLVDRVSLSEYVVKPLVLHFEDLERPPRASALASCVIQADEISLDQDDEKIEHYVLSGMVVAMLSTEMQYIVADLKYVVHRPVSPPELTYVLRGPRDCFVENLDANLCLLRYRIKAPSLRVDSLEAGRRTRTRIAVIYLADVANSQSVQEIKKRIGAIDADGILESGDLQSFLLNDKLNLFPQMGVVERSDMACGALLEGKVVILVDGSYLGLIAPRVFQEFLYSCDDSYENKYYSLFMRILRYACILLSFTLSSLYIAITAFHSEVLPSAYVIALAQMRADVPWSPLLGAFMLEFIVELLREALLRVPKKIGPAIGIVGAIIIGQAAVSANLFSPLLLILVSVSLLASFAVPDFTLMSPFRILKFVMLLFTGCFGFYGFVLGLSLILTNLVSINSFGVPYMAPLAPYNGYDLLRSFFYSKRFSPKRPHFIRTRDEDRM